MRSTVEYLQDPESTDSFEALTAPAIETTTGDLLHAPVDNDEELLKKAIAVRNLLDEEVAAAYESVRERLTRYPGIPEARLKNDLFQLEYYVSTTPDKGWAEVHDRVGRGNSILYLNCGWLHDLARNMLRNRPVEVQVAHVELENFAPYKSAIQTTYDRSFEHQKPGMRIAAMLGRISGLAYVRPVTVVDDTPRPENLFSEEAIRNASATQAYHTLLEHQAVSPTDRPGEDFSIVPLSRHTQGLEEMLARLEEAESGFVAHFTDGRIFLRPNDRIQESITQQFGKINEQIRRDGVLLRNTDGSISAPALAAATYMDPINTRFTHIGLHDRYLTDGIGAPVHPVGAEQHVSTLLQALDISHPDRDHHVYYDANQGTENIVYAFTYLLRREVQKIIDSLQSLNAVEEAMKPAAYFEHNYNDKEGIWPEDQQALSALGLELPLHYKPGDIDSAAIIGYGPFSYLSLAIAAFMSEHGAIDISDLLPGNIDFAREWFTDQASQSHNDTYVRFADQLRSHKKTGRFYANCEEMLRHAARLHVAPLEDLPSNSAQIVAESFVSCSNNIEKYGFYETIRQKARILEWGPRSMMISVHMVESGGWNNSGDHEGIKIPAARLTTEELQDGYRSAGLRIIRAVPLHADAGIRKDYKGMFLVFAKPDTIERPRSIAA